MRFSVHENAPPRRGMKVDGMDQSSSHHSRTVLTMIAATMGIGFMYASRQKKGQPGMAGLAVLSFL
jgi:hypothetical protein